MAGYCSPSAFLLYMFPPASLLKDVGFAAFGLKPIGWWCTSEELHPVSPYPILTLKPNPDSYPNPGFIALTLILTLTLTLTRPSPCGP